MRHFSIREFEHFSGIKAHTIRIWEQRYAVFNPERTDANLRRYSLADLKLLLDIAILLTNGHKISKLAAMQSADLSLKVAGLKDRQVRQQCTVNELICCMYTSATDEFDQVIEGSLLSWGIDATVREVIIPFLEKVGLLSYRNSSAEAHFVITAVRRKLIMAIESLSLAATDNRSTLLFLPKDEHYDLMLLYTFYVLKRAGFKPLYLGTDISMANLEQVCLEKKPALLFSYHHTHRQPRLTQLDGLMSRHLPDSRLFIVQPQPYLGGKQAATGIQLVGYRELESVIR